MARNAWHCSKLFSNELQSSCVRRTISSHLHLSLRCPSVWYKKDTRKITCCTILDLFRYLLLSFVSHPSPTSSQNNDLLSRDAVAPSSPLHAHPHYAPGLFVFLFILIYDYFISCNVITGCNPPSCSWPAQPDAGLQVPVSKPSLQDSITALYFQVMSSLFSIFLALRILHFTI